MAHQIFVSYSREDIDRVRPIVRVLQRHGWSVWWDQHLLAGRAFTDGIHEKLAGAKAVVVAWSEHSVASMWVQSEAHEALKRGILVPIRLDEVSPSGPFGLIHHIDHTSGGEPSGTTLIRLTRSLESLVGKPPVRPRKIPAAAQGAAARPAPQEERRSPAEPPSKVETPTTTAVARSVRPRRQSRVTLVASLVSVALGLAWIVSSSRGADRNSGVVLAGGQLRVEPFEFWTDEASGSRIPYDWEVVDATRGHDDWARQVREPTSGILFQLIEPGEFLMGSPEDEPDRKDNETLHSVRITRAYYLSVTEVSFAQAKRIAGEEGGSDHPVCQVSWSAAKTFCGLIRCDLPTEAQWEYAARAGSSTRWWWGDAPEDGRDKANVYDGTAFDTYGFDPVFPIRDSFAGTAPVGSFEANPLGLHDMIGNVWEWCSDDYREDLGSSPTVDPYFHFDGRVHVARGGSCATPLSETRAASRVSTDGTPIRSPSIDIQQTGFRVALSLP